MSKVIKDTVIVISPASRAIGKDLSLAIDELSKQMKRPLKRVWLIDKNKKYDDKAFHKDFDRVKVNFKSPKQLHAQLKPYSQRTLAIVCRAESLLEAFRNVIPHVPYTLMPTETSINWSTDKLLMRRRFTEYDKKITPAYTVAKDVEPATIRKIKRKVGFPLVIKPTGLAASVLVSICYHEEELEKNLKRTLRQVKSAHKKLSGRGEPKVLIEQYLEGVMYSIDGYVDQNGNVSYAPPVHIETGRSIGFDDFFGYKQITPVKLAKHKIDSLEETATKGIHALGLRNTIVHAEFIKTTNQGFKIIEITGRMGGFRHKLYEYSFGFDHTLNDILIRAGKKPIIKKKKLGYTAAMKFFAKTEGRLVKIHGIRKVRSIASIKELNVNKDTGDMCRFAKNGGKSVFNVMLHSPSRSELLADIRRLEQSIHIEVKKPSKT